MQTAREITENTPMIDRYRAVTLAWGYSGDSVPNSLTDIGCMALGFATARRLPVTWSVACTIMPESVAIIVIRNNLALDVLMLIAPGAATRIWQAG